MSVWAANPKPGDRLRDSWRRSFGEKGRLVHVRGIVDDDHAVLRVWSRRKKRWSYFIEPIFEDGIMGYSHEREREAAP